jgi:NADH-quinone oxidoreductase subunit A
MSQSELAGYVLIFLAVGAGFVLVNLLIGKLFRPRRPDAEKGTIYECGEPTIGSAWVQFDLRYYVIALLFVIFDVEVAFFFPWAEVFGKANAIAAAKEPTDEAGWQGYSRLVEPVKATGGGKAEAAAPAGFAAQQREPAAGNVNSAKELQASRHHTFNDNQREAGTLAWLAFWEILVFFGVLLVGFAYLWRRGDLAWVRSLPERQPAAASPTRIAMGETPGDAQAIHRPGANV